MTENEKPKTEKPMEAKLDVEMIRMRGKALWDGEVALAHCFWLYYFAAVFALSLFSNSFTGSLGTLFSLISLGWSGFMVMPIMRSADKFQGDPMWAVLAKVAAVLIAIGVAVSAVSIVF